MKLKLFIFALITLLSTVAGRATERHLSAPDVYVASGGSGFLQIDLEDDDEYTVGFQGNVDLPDGFIVPTLNDRPDRAQNIPNLARNAALTVEVSYPWGNNDVKFIGMTSDLTVIREKSGWIVKLPFSISTDIAPGVYEARLWDIFMTNKSYTEDNPPELKFNIYVTEPEDIRYSDNQLFCNDIEVNQGENTELKLSYNSSSDIYEYSASVILPAGVTPIGNVAFSDVLTSIENFTNYSSWDAKASELKVSGEYGGRRADPAPSGKKEFASVTLNTSSLTPGEYQIKVTNQVLSNDDDDYTPEEYIGYITVKAQVQAEKCSTPTITIEGNNLLVHSDTEGAIYHTTITAQDHQEVIHGENEHIELTGQYHVTSYASAEGFLDSDPITATLIWNKSDNLTTGVDDICIDKNRMILLQSVGNTLVIHGVKHGEALYLYDLSGSLLYQGSADYTPFSIPFECEAGKLYIVKVGSDTIKYIF